MEFKDLWHRTGLKGAHRGNRSVAPENTLFAFEAAIGRCDFIELDVQLSRDALPVVVHDATLERTSDAAAVYADRAPWRVADFSLAELRELDMGGWFYREDPFGTVAKGIAPASPKTPLRIPTLEEALRFARRHDLLLNVEIKEMRGDFDDESVVDAVLAPIERMQCGERLLLSSFHHPYLERIQKRAPRLLTAALQEGEHPKGLPGYLKRLGADAYHMDDAIATEAVVKSLRGEGFFVGVYTVNDSARQRELFGWGVNALFTDYV